MLVAWQVITGHSERRVGFGAAGESSELVAEKTKVRVGHRSAVHFFRDASRV